MDRKSHGLSASDYEKKIAYLEEELVRKDDLIQKLKEENAILMRTSLRQAKTNQEIMAKNEELLSKAR